MKFVVAANGSRGDVQPAVALATELTERGHEITMLVRPNLTEFSAGAGLPTQAYGDSTRAVLDSELVRERMKSRNPVTRLRAVTELTLRGGRAMQHQLLDATDGADAIISGSAGQERAHNVSRARGIPHVPVHLCPMRRNRSTSLLAHVGIDASPAVAHLSWRLVEWTLWWAGRSAEDTLCADLGLEPVRAPFATQIEATGIPEIQAYDPALFPALTAEWGSRRPLVGFFALPGGLRSGVGDEAADDLLEWIEADTPPVYVGFGSMLPSDPQRVANAFRSAAGELDLRLLVSGGWSDFMSGVTDERIRVVGHIDHDTILPRCAAAVHHGGAGSVAAGLRAGIPTVVTWVGADQPIWGRAITASHAGTSLPMSRVDDMRIVDALGAALEDRTRHTAAEMSRHLIPAAQAVSTAADVVEQAVRASRTG
ncbi:glycosyltransferase [Gordonia insulae]|uniref:Putative glycosyltransferase n=1 Tax=Gordonia insulae TaxID=2420509 RepID=A0A3G8JJM6_9ACTN|nr:glycosyltransferase [Gordonia insulae]AZG45234.1 putative glycosyltransferase [Gordonia insulae]